MTNTTNGRRLGATMAAAVAALTEAGLLEDMSEDAPKRVASMEFYGGLPWHYFRSPAADPGRTDREASSTGHRPIVFLAPLAGGDSVAVVILGKGRAEFSADSPTEAYERISKALVALEFDVESTGILGSEAGTVEIGEIVEFERNGTILRLLIVDRKGGGSELWLADVDERSRVCLVRFDFEVPLDDLERYADRVSDALLLTHLEREDLEADERQAAGEAELEREVANRERYEAEVLEKKRGSA